MNAWHRCSPYLILWSFVLAGSSLSGQEVVFDQQVNEAASSCLNVEFRLAQEFIPTEPFMDVAELYLTGGGGVPEDGLFNVVIRDRSINGRIVGISDFMRIKPEPAGQLREFVFSRPVPMAPGNPYVMELETIRDNNYFAWCQTRNDVYPHGSGIIETELNLGIDPTDFIFKTGLRQFELPKTMPSAGNYFLVESARSGREGQGGGGTVVSDEFFTGLTFQVTETTTIDRVGGHFNAEGDGSSTIFGAIVPLERRKDVPQIENALGHTLVALPSGDMRSMNVSGALNLTLEPGLYSLLFGSGMFGATSTSGGIHKGNFVNGIWSPYTVRQSDNLKITQFDGQRFFIEAKSKDGAVQLRPTVDGYYESDDGVSKFDISSGQIVSQNFVAAGLDRRGFLEFDLSGLPDNATISEAKLDLSVVTASFGREDAGLTIHGYAGDGVIDASDTLTALNSIGRGDPEGLGPGFTIELDPDYVQSLLDTNQSHLGLMTVGGSSGSMVSVNSLESGSFGAPPLLTLTLGQEELIGDFDGNGVLDANDIDLLTEGTLSGGDPAEFDINLDGFVDATDRQVLVEELMNTYFGDSDLDGEFGSRDFVHVFRAGEFEDGIAGNSTWAEGDWDGDGDFTTTDFVIAFRSGSYERGPRPVVTVPDPTINPIMFLMAFVAIPTRNRKRI